MWLRYQEQSIFAVQDGLLDWSRSRYWIYDVRGRLGRARSAPSVGSCKKVWALGEESLCITGFLQEISAVSLAGSRKYRGTMSFIGTKVFTVRYQDHIRQNFISRSTHSDDANGPWPRQPLSASARAHSSFTLSCRHNSSPFLFDSTATQTQHFISYIIHAIEK